MPIKLLFEYLMQLILLLEAHPDMSRNEITVINLFLIAVWFGLIQTLQFTDKIDIN